MFFKEKPLLTVLLLVVIIAFAFLSSYNNQVMIEAMTSGNGNDVPICEDEGVPACYSTVQYDTYSADYAPSEMDEDYILKTKIVPPVCPACPSVINAHSHDKEIGEEEEAILTPEVEGDEVVDETTSKETNITNITNEENVTNNYSEDVNVVEKVSNTQETRPEPEATQPPASSVSNSTQSFTPSQNADVKNYENQISELRGKLSALQQQTPSSSVDGSCPPCPACDRCPEPIFSCEKVVNYRSPGLSQYLPMPVLGDFSQFKE